MFFSSFIPAPHKRLFLKFDKQLFLDSGKTIPLFLHITTCISSLFKPQKIKIKPCGQSQRQNFRSNSKEILGFSNASYTNRNKTCNQAGSKCLVSIATLLHRIKPLIGVTISRAWMRKLRLLVLPNNNKANQKQ